MNPELETKLNNLPSNPGVYQFLNDKDKVIYVGKAKNLKNRVRSYFQSNIPSAKTRALVSKVEDLQLIITDSEVEALVLENNLIKELSPRYNINLKDDKTYPFIVVTNEPYPRIYPTRNVVRDGSRYFGPYTDVKSMKNSLKMINDIFRIRNCKFFIDQEVIDRNKVKLCLEYHIKKCDGPCQGLISQHQYNEMVDQATKILKGRTEELIAELTIRMNQLSSELQFEKAAEMRDKIEHLKVYSARQKIVSLENTDRDIVSIAYEGKDSACSIFIVRSGRLVGKKQIKLSLEGSEEIADVYASAIRFYYSEFAEVPAEIIIETKPSDMDTLNTWLKSISGRKIKFVIPKKDTELRQLLNMCRQNAILQLKEIQLQRMKKDGNVPYVLEALKRDLRLKELPRKIECFDISNLQGTDTVASMVVFEDGKPKKSLYRKFIIRSVEGPNDFESMREVISRRYSRVKEENEKMPDLIMVDGGKGQLSSAVQILNDLGFREFNIIGLAKRLEEVFFPDNPEAQTIPKTSSSLKLLQAVRDEAHRFAITFHRARREKRTFTSELNEIKGIGENTVKKLLSELGSLNNVREASEERLAQILGTAKAKIIRNYFINADKSDGDI